MIRYLPPDPSLWQGRQDVTLELMHQVVEYMDPRAATLPPRSALLLGFACDAGISRNNGRPGASEGPLSWRRCLAKYPLPHGRYEHFIDGGTIACVGDDLEAAQGAFAELSAAALRQGAFSMAAGGGHEIAWAHFCALEQAGYAQDLGIINIDAHYDMRPLLPEVQGTSGTSFSQIAEHLEEKGLPFRYLAIGIQEFGNTASLYSRAKAAGCMAIKAEAIHYEGFKAALPLLQRVIAESRYLYLTLCLDVFAAPYAPGVSAPQPLGLTPWQVIPLLREVALSGKLIACDIAELCPRLDRDDLTARLAAALTLEVLSTL